MIIPHALPQPSGFVIIAQPGRGEPIGDRVQTPCVKAVLKCPKTGAEHVAEIHDVWRFSIADQVEEQLITAISKLAYGITGPQLMSVMRKRYPEMQNQIEFLLLKPL